MIGLCHVCKQIGLDARWEELCVNIRHARCDHCKLYGKDGTLTGFHATEGELKQYVALNPKSQILALGTLNDGRTGDPLYCVSFWWKPLNGSGQWKMEEIYLHAKSDNEARWTFFASHTNIKVNIIAIGPVVGWHVENEKTGKLVA